MGNTTSERMSGERHSSKIHRSEGAIHHAKDHSHKIMVGSTDDPNIFSTHESKVQYLDYIFYDFQTLALVLIYTVKVLIIIMIYDIIGHFMAIRQFSRFLFFIILKITWKSAHSSLDYS